MGRRPGIKQSTDLHLDTHSDAAACAQAPGGTKQHWPDSLQRPSSCSHSFTSSTLGWCHPALSEVRTPIERPPPPGARSHGAETGHVHRHPPHQSFAIPDHLQSRFNARVVFTHLQPWSLEAKCWGSLPSWRGRDLGSEGGRLGLAAAWCMI